jgi:pimeloyl-ACP methyl ester carboxylesterase
VQSSLAPGKFAALPRTIHSVATGDSKAAATEIVNGLTPPGIIGYGLTYGVFCREDAPFAEPAAAIAAAAQVFPDFPQDVLALEPQAPRLFSDCSVWDVGRADDAVHRPARSDVPVLLMNGTLDAVTSLSQAEVAAATLPHSLLVPFPGLGHDVYSASDCGRQIMADFLNRPDGYDTSCAKAIKPPTFLS